MYNVFRQSLCPDRRIFLLLAAVVGLSPLQATEFYVSPQGTPFGDGSIIRPWDLQTALNQPPAIQPGDTIWLRGGTYAAPRFTSNLTGTPSAPIIVRQYPGERATLDGAGATPDQPETLQIRGAYTWYWGFEITNSDPVRVVATTCTRNNAVTLASSTGVKLINLVIHDAGQGIGYTSSAINSEIYGTLVYNNGCLDSLRGHGHGIYVQGVSSDTKRINDNIIFNQFGMGVHAYGSKTATLDNLRLDGNIVFDNGILTQPGDFAGNRNILIGGATPVQAPSLVNNIGYYPLSALRAANFNLGYLNGATDLLLKSNYIAGGFQALEIDCNYAPCTYKDLSDNTVIGIIENFAGPPYPYASNVHYAKPPVQVDVFVRPNRYEPDRANIAIFNWPQYPYVTVDVAAALKPGDAYELRDAQNFFGPPILSGVYAGDPLRVPTNLSAVALPVGYNLPVIPPHTSPEFLALVLLKKSSAPVQNTISNVKVTSITGNSAVITWTTSLASDTQVEYGKTTSYGLTSVLNTVPATTHSVLLTGLSSSTTYHFRARSRDANNNLVVSPDSTFTTASTIPPTLSALAVSAITTSGATITWQTNEPATTVVEYGLTSSYGSVSPADSSLATVHSVTLTGLSAGTTYHFRARSADAEGVAGLSADATFKTADAVTAPLAVQSTISSVLISSVTTSSAVISWFTASPANSQIVYGLTTAYGMATAVDSRLLTNHSMTLTGLTPATTYHYRVLSRDTNGNVFVSSDLTFSTDNNNPPSILTKFVSATSTSLSIYWSTDKAADSRVDYGLSSAYGLSVQNPDLVPSHNIVISGLTPATVYYVRITSKTSTGLTVTSSFTAKTAN
jgi:hypothetical protein